MLVGKNLTQCGFLRLYMRGVGTSYVPEESDRHEYSCGDQGWKAVFGLHLPVCRLFLDVLVACDAGGDEAEEGTDANAEVGEACGASAEVVLVFVDVCDCCEEEVEVAVAYFTQWVSFSWILRGE